MFTFGRFVDQPEVDECVDHFPGIVRRSIDQEIDVAGPAGIAVVADRETADDDVFSPMLGHQLQEFLEFER